MPSPLSTTPRPDTEAHGLLEPLLDAEQLADVLGRTKDWVYDEVQAGRLPAVRLGRRLRFEPAVIQAWIAERRTCSPS